MKKLCFSCFKKIPLFAGKCPYCLDQHQGVYGRLIIGIVLVVSLLAAAHFYGSGSDSHNIESVLEGLKK